MKTLTSKQIQDYIDKGGNHCPSCGSKDIEGGTTLTDSGIAWQKVRCHDCKFEFQDSYRLVGICDLEGQNFDVETDFHVVDDRWTCKWCGREFSGMEGDDQIPLSCDEDCPGKPKWRLM